MSIDVHGWFTEPAMAKLSTCRGKCSRVNSSGRPFRIFVYVHGSNKRGQCKRALDATSLGPFQRFMQMFALVIPPHSFQCSKFAAT